MVVWRQRRRKAILRAHFAEEQMPDQDRAEWTKVVADFETSDLSQREFAKERMLSLSNLRYWIYRLRKESRPLVTEPTERSVNKAERRPAKKGLILKPVRVVGSAPKARQGEDGVGLLELALPSGTRLRFPAGTDLEYLRALATAL